MESDRGFYSDSLTWAQALSLWGRLGVERVILRISIQTLQKRRELRAVQGEGKGSPLFLTGAAFVLHTLHT